MFLLELLYASKCSVQMLPESASIFLSLQPSKLNQFNARLQADECSMNLVVDLLSQHQCCQSVRGDSSLKYRHQCQAVLAYSDYRLSPTIVLGATDSCFTRVVSSVRIFTGFLPFHLQYETTSIDLNIQDSPSNLCSAFGSPPIVCYCCLFWCAQIATVV